MLDLYDGFTILLLVSISILLISGFLSVFYRYLTYLKIKNSQSFYKISNKLEDSLRSQFWLFNIYLSPQLNKEFSNVIEKNSDLNNLNKKSALFLKIQLVALLTGIGLFAAFIELKIITSWFARYF